jgi:CHASE3 domain sensor protein
LRGAARVIATTGPALVVGTVGLATFLVIGRSRETREQVAYTTQVLAAAHDARTALVDMETGHRGFVIAGET